MFPNIIMMNCIAEVNEMIGNNHISIYVNGNKIDKSKTLKENNIKVNTIILLKYSDFKHININFISEVPNINYKIHCYDIYLFSTIEQKLYKEYPELKDKNIIFKVEGNKIDKSLTLEENNIKNDSIISLNISDGKLINVTFSTCDQYTNCTISCYDSEIFSDIEKELYKEAPEMQKKYYFICNGNKLYKSLTFAQNKITDKNIILIPEEGEEEDKSNELISISFKNFAQSINCSIPCYITDEFSKVEEKLILKYPILIERKVNFLYNGAQLKKTATLKKIC